jgi:hypothetical protein
MGTKFTVSTVAQEYNWTAWAFQNLCTLLYLTFSSILENTVSDEIGLTVDMQQNYLSCLYIDCTSEYLNTFGKLALVLDDYK